MASTMPTMAADGTGAVAWAWEAGALMRPSAGARAAGRGRGAGRRRRRYSVACGCPRPGGPELAVVGGAHHGGRQRTGVAMGHVQSRHAVLDHFGHAADATGDHWPAVEEGFLDDERRVLPPHRRDDGPVDPGHQAGDLPGRVGAQRDHVGCRLLDQLAHVLGEGARLERHSAVQSQLEVEATLGQLACGAQQDGHTLPGALVAEIAEHRPATIGRGAVGCRRRGGAAIGNDLQAAFRDAPFDEAVGRELAGRDEQVDGRQQGLQVALPQDEAIRRNVREARAATVRRCLVAKLARAGLHHQAFIGAGDEVIVERQHDPAIGQDAADQRDDLGAQQQHVVEMHHRRAGTPRAGAAGPARCRRCRPG